MEQHEVVLSVKSSPWVVFVLLNRFSYSRTVYESPERRCVVPPRYPSLGHPPFSGRRTSLNTAPVDVFSCPFESIFRGIVDAPPAVPCCIVSLPHQLWGDSVEKRGPTRISICARSYSIKGEASRVWICTGSGTHQHQAATWTLHDCPIAKAFGLCLYRYYLHGADNLMALREAICAYPPRPYTPHGCYQWHLSPSLSTLGRRNLFPVWRRRSSGRMAPRRDNAQTATFRCR
ncbi:hypothetical protein V8C34DRAFT_284240 [Trichoderma compactum]